MIPLLLLRHGPTEWSQAGRIQGRTDTALSENARLWLRQRRLPEEFLSWRRYTSPLQRCVETGEALGLLGAQQEPRIIEMSWGAWEGRRLTELRAELTDSMRENEDRGWDFRPTDGESPREVRARVGGWLAQLVQFGQPAFAVTHRGVIRVVLAQAYGWDMLGRPPVKLDWNAGHLFTLDAEAQPHPQRMNLPLVSNLPIEGAR